MGPSSRWRPMLLLAARWPTLGGGSLALHPPAPQAECSLECSREVCSSCFRAEISAGKRHGEWHMMYDNVLRNLVVWELHIYFTFSLVLSFKNGLMTVRAPSTYQGWLIKWMPLNFAGKQSCKPSIMSFKILGVRFDDWRNENSLQSTMTTNPLTWFCGTSIKRSRVRRSER